MKTPVALAGALGICAWCFANLHADPALTALPHAEVYQRATNEFAEALFFKPAETRTNDLSFTLAPLLLQEVMGANEPLALHDRFGALSVSSDAPAVLDPSQLAIYWEADTVQIRGKSHARFCYIWCYAPFSHDSGQQQRTNSLSPDPVMPVLPLQGVRITLSAAGQPVLWEVLAESSGAALIYVSQNLEAAAVAEFGKPLPGRRYSIESSVAACPGVIVARVVDDSPVSMGPIVYLSAGTRRVSTLICRCMPAQARKLLATHTYDLLPFEIASTNSLILQVKAMAKTQLAFWPGDHAGGSRLETSLRLPEAFSSPQVPAAR